MFSKSQIVLSLLLVLTAVLCKNDDFETKSLNEYIDNIKHVRLID
jgi:hypothetical protein